MGESENDSVTSDTPGPPPFLVDAEGNEVGLQEKGKSYKYRDFSHVNEDDEEALGDGASPAVPPPSRNSMETSIRVQKFPVKLYAILAQKEFNEIITWMPHGRSWKVLKPNIFESLVMPLFFEYSNYHSFNRLVNAWSFRRVSSGPDRGSYYHELFLRGKPHLQKYMRRLPKTHKKLPMLKQDEPDFYRLDQTNPLPALEDAPIPGGLAASSVLNGLAADKRPEQPALVSPSDSPTSRGGSSVGGRIAVPQAQRLCAGPAYGGVPGNLDPGMLGGGLQDDFGDMYPPSHEQPLTAQQLQEPPSARGVMPSTSGAFRSPMVAPGLPGQRFRPAAVSMLDTNGAAMAAGAGHELDIGVYGGQLSPLRNNAQMAPLNNRMVAHAYGRPGQMGVKMSPPHSDPRAMGQPLGGVTPVTPGLRASYPPAGTTGIYSDLPQQRSIADVYQRDVAYPGSVAPPGIGGAYGDDCGVAAPVGSMNQPQPPQGSIQ